MRVRPPRHATPIPTVLLTLAALLVGCSNDSSNGSAQSGTSGGRPTGAPVTVRVPEDATTIGEAVARATPDSLVLIAPGTYRESVRIETDGITLRGLDRNAVIIDGEDRRENGVQVFSDDVTVENLTVANHKGNGVIFSGDYAAGRLLRGYRMAHLTAINNGLYGLYAFSATDGVIEQSTTSGHPDAGVYIGQCGPCNAVVREVTSIRNQYGIQLTNAGGNLIVTGNRLTGNRVGLNLNSSDVERQGPQADAVIVGNVIADNVAADAPSSREGWGTGIAISGGTRNRIEHNLVTGHPVAGAVTVQNERYLPDGNRFSRNRFAGNAIDLALLAGSGNCVADNEHSSPQQLAATAGFGCPEGGLAAGSLPPFTAPPGIDYRKVPPPGPQPTMDRPADSPHPRPSVPSIAIDRITTPT